MTATVDPRAETVKAPAVQAGVLDRAHGIELLGEVHGSGYRDGAALVRRADGQMLQLGPLMYGLLECVDGRRGADALAECLSERTGRRFDEEHVQRLAAKLASQGLLAGTEENAPPRRNPLLALRWKVLVTNPTWTRRLTAPFTLLYRPWIVWPVVTAFVAVLAYVLFFKGVASATADAFNNPGLLLLVFVLAVASAGFHELGHAAACRYGGATPGGMGMGIYMVWPAFYTDVTDAYRLPKVDRLRVDLGGLYFNAIIAVVTLGVWLAWHVDALLLLVALQLLIMVKNLSPVIRSDGYHILADATGVPDLYAHIAPTVRRLFPGHRREPSALKGRARALVTLWVLVVVPVLLSLMLGAVLLLPRLLTSTWDSGHAVAASIGHAAAHGHVLAAAARALRLVALALPVLGSILITQRVLRTTYARANAWSAGSVRRRAVVVAGAALAAAGAAWAWWPSGQYRPVRPTDRGTLISFSHAIASPVSTLRPVTPVDAVLTPGTHLAVSMVPVNGATRQHPALFVIAGRDGKPSVALLLSRTRAPVVATHLAAMHGSTTTAAPPLQAATAFPFKLPAKPGPGDSQALSVNTTDGGVTYDVAYSLVTVSGGGPVTNQNSAYAFASCTACKTVAVSFQVVLIVGQSNVIAPINAAGSLNANCPACVTVAIADQLVVTLTKQPPQQLVDELNAALAKLNAIPALGAGGTPAEIASEVQAVQTEIENDLSASGLLAHPVGSSSPTPTSGTSPTAGAQPTPTTTRTAPTTTATTTSPPTTTSSSASTGAGPTTTAPTTTNAPTTTSAASTDQTTTAGTTAPATTTTGG